MVSVSEQSETRNMSARVRSAGVGTNASCPGARWNSTTATALRSGLALQLSSSGWPASACSGVSQSSPGAAPAGAAACA